MPKSKRGQIGKVPPRYSFILNPHRDLRCSTCPTCDQRTRIRRIVLSVVMDESDIAIVKKMCKFCVACDLVICHQDELEPLISQLFEGANPAKLSDRYMVIGTVDRAIYLKGARGEIPAHEVMESVATFKKNLVLEYQPAGWYRKE